MATCIAERYELLQQLGRGAMGVVYLALDRRLGRQVAVKLMSTACEMSAELRQRFELEARRAAALNHPNILTVYDSGAAEERPYFVAEYIAGQDLQQLLYGSSRLPLTELLRIFLEVCDGLAYAHGHGVVHRDLKPGNIRVTQAGHAKIMDFGIARLVGDASTQLTAAGMVLGTPEYLSPEGIMGAPVDHRADIFAMGVLLYEMLTGRRAFERSSAGAVMLQILQEDVDFDCAPLPRLPRPLNDALRRALNKDPEQRIQNAEELAAYVRAGQQALDQAGAAGLERPQTSAATRLASAASSAQTVRVRSEPQLRRPREPAAAPAPAPSSGPASRHTLTIPLPSLEFLLQRKVTLGLAALIAVAAAVALAFRLARAPSPQDGIESVAAAAAGAVPPEPSAALPEPVPVGEPELGSGSRSHDPPPLRSAPGRPALPKPEPKPPPPNQPPRIVELSIDPAWAGAPIKAGAVLSLALTYHDPEGRACRIQWSAPQGGRLLAQDTTATLDTSGLAAEAAQTISVIVSVTDPAGAAASRTETFTITPAFEPRAYLVGHDHSDLKFWSTQCEGELRIGREALEYASGKHVLSVTDPARLAVQPWKDGGVEIVDRGAGKAWHFTPVAGAALEPGALFEAVRSWLRYRQERMAEANS